MSTFQNIIEIKCKEGHPKQNINEYLLWGTTLKPICFDCKDDKSDGQYYRSKEINKKLQEILNEIKYIATVKSKLLESIKKFRIDINNKLDIWQNNLDGDFNKILYHKDVQDIKEYYEIVKPVHDATKHIYFATTFLKFEKEIGRSDFTNSLFNQVQLTDNYSQNISTLSELINNFQFKEQPSTMTKSIQPPLPTKPVQYELQSVQICQQIERSEYTNLSTPNKLFCLTIKPLKSFTLTTLWISMLANQNKKPLLDICIHQYNNNDPIISFEFQIDQQTPITNEKYKVQLESQCKLQEGYKYSISIEHQKDYNCLSADFFRGVSITTNQYFEIIKEAFIAGDGKQIINQTEDGLICDVDIMLD